MEIMIGTLLGFLSGLGIGGGSLLILWLTMVMGMDPETARSVNLLFYLPGALLATVLRRKKGQLRQLLPAILSGCTAAAVCTWLGAGLDRTLLEKLFGGLLIVTGLREIFYQPRTPHD